MHKGDVSKEYPLHMYSHYEHRVLGSYVQVTLNKEYLVHVYSHFEESAQFICTKPF